MAHGVLVKSLILQMKAGIKYNNKTLYDLPPTGSYVTVRSKNPLKRSNVVESEMLYQYYIELYPILCPFFNPTTFALFPNFTHWLVTLAKANNFLKF